MNWTTAQELEYQALLRKARGLCNIRDDAAVAAYELLPKGIEPATMRYLVAHAQEVRDALAQFCSRQDDEPPTWLAWTGDHNPFAPDTYVWVEKRCGIVEGNVSRALDWTGSLSSDAVVKYWLGDRGASPA